MTDKLIRDGKVAVLVSENYGAGWSTWNKEHVPKIIFDKDVVLAVLDGNHDKAEAIAKEKYTGCYVGGVENLIVEWVPVGARFIINEYDGNESLSIIDETYGYIA